MRIMQLNNPNTKSLQQILARLPHSHRITSRPKPSTNNIARDLTSGLCGEEDIIALPGASKPFVQ